MEISSHGIIVNKLMYHKNNWEDLITNSMWFCIYYLFLVLKKPKTNSKPILCQGSINKKIITQGDQLFQQGIFIILYIKLKKSIS